MSDIKCSACGDEGGPHGIVEQTLLCESCIELHRALGDWLAAMANTCADLDQAERRATHVVRAIARLLQLAAATNMKAEDAKTQHPHR